MIVYRRLINMVPGGQVAVINMSQYDSDVTLEFELYASEGTFVVESGTTVLIRGTKPDGNGISLDGTLESTQDPETGQYVHLVTVEVTQQMTAVAGKALYELSLRKDNVELNTANFVLDIERAPLDKDTPPSGSEIREIIDTIDRTDEFLGAAHEIAEDKAEIEEMLADTQAAKAAAESAADSAADTLVEVNAKAAQIQEMTTNAEETAAAALQSATNAENDVATFINTQGNLKDRVDALDLEVLGFPDDAYVENGVAYFTHNGQVLYEITGIGGGGGGGGGASTTLTVTNTTGWLTKTIASGRPCEVSLTWSSTLDGIATGDGTLNIYVNNVIRGSIAIQQGNITQEVGQYLQTGSNTVRVQVVDIDGNSRAINFQITCVALALSSTFDTDTVYQGAFSFPCTPVGAVEKTIYYYLDGTLLGTQTTSVSGRQVSYPISAQTHGAHSLRVYFEATINEETVSSNELYFEFIAVDPLDNTPIIASSFNQAIADQYSLVPIPFRAYTPGSLTSTVQIYEGETLISTQTVDRTWQSYSYRANTATEEGETIDISFKTGNVTKTVSFAVTESEIDVEPVTDNLVLYLSAEGKSNNDSDKNVWTYGTGQSAIAASFSDFNWTSDGWQKDSDGATCLRVAGDARVSIPYKIFENDFRSSGKTIELEFATWNVMDYDAVILSCVSGGRGLTVTAQKATLASEQSSISAQYKEDEHTRLAFVAEKRSENRFLWVYIDGIPSGILQYPDNDDFSQQTPVNISIGSDDCTIDIYNIRVYDNSLSGNEILDNWIADTQDGGTMLERYTRNTVYDAYGKIVASSLPAYLPYFILNADELPQYKGDKKTISGQYVDPLYPSKSFTFTGCQINVQGTSSAVYARKNYDMQFKNGFELSGGTHASTYHLRPGDIPFNRFVLKADVASSEGANNVELVRLYNDACPYKTPEMVANSKVRWGIDGFPIAVFWNDTQANEIKFWGKYNFNLPKRAPAPYGYDPDSSDEAVANMESWEFQNNTSDLMLFLTDTFDETMVEDPDTGDIKEAWRYDYEARFPSDEWTDYTLLQELQSFIYSTYRDEATGDDLDESVTYEGTTYTKDTSAYRLAKFRNEFPDYAVLDSFLFYYIFTELFLMVDSRAKNLFIGFNGAPTGRAASDPYQRKATAQPYDMDTAAGTNNEGTLVFGYGLEDTDHLTGGANIFNGQDSVLWCNLRDAFPQEIRQMYQSLRSAGTISYTSVEQRYEDHQDKWPEAVWIEDSKFKYTDPLTNPDPGKEPTADYLTMLQGSKAQQRKWWLSNRFKYMDSKWNAGDALSQVVILRAYAKANITVTPYTDLYPTIKYASRVVSARATRGTPTTLTCPLDTMSDTEISIYSAPQLASLGDLSPLMVGFANFSVATRLQEIKIGDDDSEYENTNLYSLTLGNNVLLKKLDVTNCSGLGDTSQEGHTQTTVDLSNCSIIEEIYFDGTNITGVTLPNGGNIKKLHLPSTITNLTVLNQKNITEFVVEDDDYSNVKTLWVENSSDEIPVNDILAEMAAGSRVRLVGFEMTASSTSDVEDFYDYLDTMKGLDESGGNVETAQVSGTITGLGTITGEWYASMLARYPYITIEYEHISSSVYFYNGTTLLDTVSVNDGGDATYSGTTPTKTQDAQYTYSFAGWSKSNNNVVDADALKHVEADRNVYACFTGTVRTYTVTFVKASDDGGGTLQTLSNKAYGSTIRASDYTGSTPTTSKGSATDYPFLGWNPSLPVTVTGATTITAVFGSPVVVEEITDSWDTIIANIDNGTYKTKYSIGNYKPLDLGTEGTINMQIVAKDKDVLSDNTANAPLTFIAMKGLNTRKKMYYSGTGINWANSWIRNTYLPESILPLIPSNVAKRIQSVIKTYDPRGQGSASDTLVEKLWIPSAREMFKYIPNEEASGPKYSDVYEDNASRIKQGNTSTDTGYGYWLRSSYGMPSNYRMVESDGRYGDAGGGGNERLIALGFCLGYEPETITDDWATILSNADYATDYSIGDTKYLDLGTEGKQLMEIVAFDTDDKADNSGKAKITWISKTILTTMAMNSTENTSINWSNCAVRDYLRNTVKPLIPSVVRDAIVEVTKVSTTNPTGGESGSYIVSDGVTTTDDLWIPSAKEFGNTQGYTVESTGAVYYTTKSARRKTNDGTTTRTWTRSRCQTYRAGSSYTYHKFYVAWGNGTFPADASMSVAHAVCLGFCTD